MAIGTVPAPLSTTAPVVETWNGTSWTVIAFAPDLGPTGDGVAVHGVSCGTPTSCAINWDLLVDDQQLPHLSVWNGTSWTTAPVSAVESIGSTVACAADGSCVFAADFSPTVVWDGSSFEVFTFDDDGVHTPDLHALSCLADDDCLGISYDSRSIHWDGSTWSEPGVALPGASETSTTAYTSISCTSTDRCVAVGDVADGPPGSSPVPLAARWDGTTWTPTPLPVADGRLRSVSCASAIACVAIGTSTVGTPGTSHPIALAWNGGTWYRAQDPPAPSGASYAEIGCGVGDRCMAVGAVTTAGVEDPLASTYAWQP